MIKEEVAFGDRLCADLMDSPLRCVCFRKLQQKKALAKNKNQGVYFVRKCGIIVGMKKGEIRL